jgi:anaerobic selenocysteine-containing dehydrogenase
MAKYFTTCLRDCYDTCLIESSYLKKEIKEIKGAGNHPVTSGFLCPKGNKLLSYYKHETRIKTPLAGQFLNWRNVSWEKALKIIAERIEKYPDKIGFYSYYGSTGIISRNFPQRFFRKIGAIGFESSICDRNGQEVLKAMNYQGYQLYPEDIENYKQVVIWGANPKWSSLHHWFLLLKHKLRIIGIDPIKTVTLKDAHQILRPEPSSDWYLAYGIAKLMIENEFIDEDYVKENVENFEEIKKWIMDNISIEEVLEKTKVTIEQINKFVKNIKKFNPGYFYIGYGIQRQKNGGEIVRAIATLAALSGYKIFFSRMREDKRGTDYVKGSFIGKLKQVNQLMLPEMIEKGDIKTLFVFNSNPVSTSPNSNRIKDAFLKDDIFIIVSDIFFTDTAKLANVILPSSTFFEYFDIATSFFHNYIQINQKVISPMFESKSNYEQFRLLSKTIGLKDDYLYEPEEEIAEKVLSFYGYTLKELKKAGFLKIPEKEKSDGRIKLLLDKDNFPEYPLYEEEKRDENSLRLISPIHRDLLSSQYYKITTSFLPGRVFININDAKKLDVRSGDRVLVYNEKGKAEMSLEVKNEVPEGVALIYKAPWESSAGYSPNIFTEDKPHPIYKGSQFHSSFIKIEKI